MAYDALAESVALLEGAAPSGHARLSRRVRHLPLALDRDGEVAATMFLRRGVSGVPEVDVHALERTEGVWRLLGGGGGPGPEAGEARPRLADLGGPAVGHGGGGLARPRTRWWRRSAGWVSWAELRVAEEVAALRVGTRLLPVAAHGCAVLVWAARTPPSVVALDAGDISLGPVRIDP